MASEYWDIHNHLLPGVDDGSCCMQETLDLLQSEYDQGIRHIVLTPHYRPGMFNVKADERERIYNEVCEKAAPLFPDMDFYLGCENFAHKHMISDLKDERCRMAGTKIILLEFSPNEDYDTIEQTIDTVSAAGMFTVLAHVERYKCMYESDERVMKLRGRGALIQVNAGTVIGNTGRPQRRLARRLIREGLVDFIASDAHSVDGRPVYMEKAMEAVTKEFGTEVTERLFRINQERLFGKF